MKFSSPASNPTKQTFLGRIGPAAVLCILIFMSCLGPSGKAATRYDNDLPLLNTKVKTVAAFKNGLGFVLRGGETPLSGGWARMEQIPPAALGTFWMGAGDRNSIAEVVSY